MFGTSRTNARTEAIDRLNAVGLCVAPDQAMEALLTRDWPTEAEMTAMFPDIAAERDHKTYVETEIEFNRRVNTVLWAAGVLLRVNGPQERLVSYGSYAPFYHEQLERTRESFDEDNTAHLLAGFLQADSAREYRYITGLSFPDSTRISLDLTASKCTSDVDSIKGDALRLPVREGSLTSVQTSDLLHMLIDPQGDLPVDFGSMTASNPDKLDLVMRFLDEVEAALRPGGSLIMAEGSISYPMTGHNFERFSFLSLAEDDMYVPLLIDLVESKGFRLVTSLPTLTGYSRSKLYSIMGNSNMSTDRAKTKIRKQSLFERRNQISTNGLHFVKQ